MPHKDPVTPDVYDEVIKRDQVHRFANLIGIFRINPDTDFQGLIEMWEEAKQNPCIAPMLDPLDSGACLGRLTLDHVHRHAGGTKGKRAASDEQHLVTLCALHHLGEGDKGGRIWATANRMLVRAYLNAIYGEDDA
jgi:hypothetical protein